MTDPVTDPNQPSSSPDISPQLPTPELRPVNRHQSFLQSLISAGLDSHQIENEWRRYYNSLSPEDKQHVWQMVQSRTTTSRPPVIPQPTPFIQTRPSLLEIGKNMLSKAKNLRQWRWRQPTKLGGQKNYILKQNLKALGIGAAAFCLTYGLFQITFFNENYLQPYIRPAVNVADAAVIITPGVQTVDPAPKLYIPKLALELAVDYDLEPRQPSETAADLEARFQNSLKDSVVHYPTTGQPGQGHNVVIVGHSGGNFFTSGNPNYKFAFSRLRDLGPDDLIVANYQSRQYVYKVYKRQIVNPADVWVLSKIFRPHSLVLITCDPPGGDRNRLIVWAEQISPNPSRQTKSGQLIDSDQLNDLPGNSPSLFNSLLNSQY